MEFLSEFGVVFVCFVWGLWVSLGEVSIEIAL